MKKIILPIVALLFVSFTVSESSLNKSEKSRAVTEMKNTSKHLAKAIKGLSTAQLNYKSSPDSWSIAECTEHITISENNIFAMLEGALKSKADASKRSEVKLSDAQILKMMVNRTTKVKTQKPFEPTGKFGNHKETFRAFKAKRKSNIKFLKNTKEDLRNKYAQLPFGTIDAYQVLLFMSAHTERHVLQIEEIKIDPEFPKK